MDDMKVANRPFNFLNDDGSENKDWDLSLLHNTFSHIEACEFIFFLGGDNEEMQAIVLNKLKDTGFSNNFLEECKDAIKRGFHYVCFYS